MATLYETLDSLCKSAGITGAKMCADLKISKSLMTDLKSGRKKGVNAETAQKIATYFGVSVGYLLGENEQKNNAPGEITLTEDEQRILMALRKKTPEERKALSILLGIDLP
jgi:transcriptional regulator with XRE-family HTH domain